MAKSMNGQSKTWQPTMFEDSSSAISSPGSEAGVTPSDSLDGLTTEQSGPGVVPVSRGAWRERIKAPMIPAIFGRRGSGSSASARLQRSLENRALMRSCGLTEHRKNLNLVRMPSGRLFSRLWVSERPINGTDFTLLPTVASQTQVGSLRLYGGQRAYKKLDALGRLRIGMAARVRLATWMMGYDNRWLRASCVGSAMPSSRKSRKSSSKAIVPTGWKCARAIVRASHRRMRLLSGYRRDWTKKTSRIVVRRFILAVESAK